MPTQAPRQSTLPICCIACIFVAIIQTPTTSLQAAEPLNPRKATLSLDRIEPRPEFAEATTKPDESEPPPQALRYLKNAQERFDEGLWADAATALERALKIAPNLVPARLLLARTALQHGNLTLAESHLLDILKAHPRHPAAHQLLGEIALQRQKPAEAILQLRLALMATEAPPGQPAGPPCPERVLTHLSLALALKAEGYLTAAAEQLDAYIRTTDNPTPEMRAHRELRELTILYRGKASAMLGDIQSDLGRHDLAADAYCRAGEENPQDKSLQASLAQALGKAGRHDEAVQLAAKNLETADNIAEAVALLEEACRLAGNPGRVEVELLAIARRTENPGVQLRLAELLVDRGQSSEAADILKNLTEGEDGNREAMLLLAELHIRLAQPGELLPLLRRLLEMDVTLYIRVEELIRRAHTGGLGERLSADIQRAAGAADDDPAALFLLACDQIASDNRAGAIESCRAALRIDRNFAPAAVLVARADLQRRKWREAIQAVDASIEDGLAIAELFVIKGRAHDAFDEHEEAEAAFLEAFRLDRKNPTPLSFLAESIERRGDTLRAEQLYRRILDDVDPREDGAREKLIRLQLNSGKTDRAKEYFADFERLGRKGAAVERCRALLNLATSKLPGGEERLKQYRDELHKLTQAYPDEAATHVALAMSYEAVGEFDTALKEVDIALRLDPDDTAALERKAEYVARNLDFDGASGIVERLLEYRPRDLGYQQRLVRLALARGALDVAATQLQEILKRDDPAEIRAAFLSQLVTVLRYAKRFDESIRTAREWLDDAPDDFERRDLYLTTLRAAERMDEAVDAAKKWLADDPTNALLRRQYLSQLILAKRHVEAQQRIIAWLATDPDDLELNRLLIRIFWEEKDWTSAIDTIQTGMEDPRHRSQYEQLLGFSYRFAGRWDEAVELYRRRAAAAGIDPTDRDLIETLIDAGRFDEAEKTITAALAPDPNARPGADSFDIPRLLRLRRYLSRIYQLTGRMAQSFQQLEEMFGILEKLAQMNPTSPDIKDQLIGINNDLGYTYVDEGVQLDKAEKMIRLAIADQPLNGAYIDSLGWTYYKRGMFEAAASHLKLAILLSASEDAVMYDHLGDALYRAGQPDAAKENWEKALELSSDDQFPPPIAEDRRVHQLVRDKLKALSENKPVETAPLARTDAASRPADEAPDKADDADASNGSDESPSDTP